MKTGSLVSLKTDKYRYGIVKSINKDRIKVQLLSGSIIEADKSFFIFKDGK